MAAFLKAIVAVLLLCALFVAWYIGASDYSDSVTSGTYYLSQNGETSNLILTPDHRFQQQLTRSGKVLRAEGDWRRVGEGGVAFSKEFLTVSGQEPGPDGTAYGDIQKRFGVLVSLTLSQYHVLWYLPADPASAHTIFGTYNGDEPGVSATLVLKPDHTFEQTLSRSTEVKHAKGTWTARSGELVFSRDFLKTSGEPLNDDETASVEDPRGANLQIEIAITSKTGPPTFHKKQFPW